MFKEALVAYLKVLYQYLPAMTMRKTKALLQDRLWAQILNTENPNHEARELSLQKKFHK
jgi:hypothetical protein